MSSKKWLVIGITGATCSGKTTLANRLQKELKNSIIVHQDNYFWPIDDPQHVKIPKLNHLNWELMSSMDMDKMRSDILKLIEFSPNDVNKMEKNCKRVLIIDGFLLFKWKEGKKESMSHEMFQDTLKNTYGQNI
uniref:nicotinamide riboside kinase 1 isoform X1 n=3 Tax=Osmia lignaria TaxID=473952 RepID=UPI0014796A8F|nr:nicotinamide riboside kinase 1 isoform X1 [Osmia lignaria]